MLKLTKSKKGFTLIEMMVAVAIFSLVMGTAATLLVSSMKAQRRSLSYQQLADQVSFATEYMSRSARMAKKELFDHTYTCLSSSGANFENPGGDDSRLRFIKFDHEAEADVCQEFYLDGGQLMEYKRNLATGEEETMPLTSEQLEVNSMTFRLSGETQNDNIQPLFTVFWDIEGIGKEDEKASLDIQTSISQRNLDIRR
jgi:prepilin-type N-terminal cleavage/methylation domain-containing protein